MAWDVIVIGGGHAGCEAAAAAARMGARTLLLTMRRDMIGAMSCNPAIGGIGKGHLVRELDIFDGIMARAADAAAIHHRMLNRSKGAAVRGPRVQADRGLYRQTVQAAIATHTNLEIIEGQVESLLVEQDRVIGVQSNQGSLHCKAVILATGTFLGARLHLGLASEPGGRFEERAATALAAQLRALKLPMARLKTGTPPRIDGRTIDWAAVELQPSDSEPWTFSPLTLRRQRPQIACGITRTTQRTHDIIRANLDRSPLYAGEIEGRGPRYCPSIEDKVVRFGDRDGHQIFLEPETLDQAIVYPNGLSTSLPVDVQAAVIRSIPGLEQSRIAQPGYAVEYDHVDPRALDARLGLRALPGLFCAGQINGTTGYEEAAAQGLVAGLNAAAEVFGGSPVLFDRNESYIGVMVDDLTLQGLTEPYRMLTARAERRLHLRSDNAVTRLGGASRKSGAIGEQRVAHIAGYERAHASAHAALVSIGAAEVRRLADPAKLIEVYPALSAHGAALAEATDDICYAPYLERDQAARDRSGRDRLIRLDTITDYAAIGGLSNEMVERLSSARPADLAAASRIRGITPAALSSLLVAARRAA